MSHHTNVFSPPGTPLLDRTVGELVAERPGRSRIFQAAGIDFCCQGGRTVREACERKGLAPEPLVEQLEAELAQQPSLEENPAQLPPAELAAYIVEKHHAYLWAELPRLYAMAARVAQVHGGHTPSLVELFDVFTALQEELASHMMKEEQILFPAVTMLSRGERATMPLDGPIDCMVHEHEEAGNLLAKIRQLTNDFHPPGDACNTYRALFSGLHELEDDLHRHIHLENAVLFPMAQALASRAA